MIKILFFLSIIFFASNCSLDSKTGIWSQTKKVKKEIKKEKIIKEKKELFTEDKAFKNEFNPKLLIRIKEKTKKNSFVNNLNNNLGRIKYDGNLKKTSRFKFSKIKNFNNSDHDLIFDKDNIIFFEHKGTVLKFDSKSKLIWKKNYYSKREKKLEPTLFFSNNSKILVVADNIAKYYAIDINTGDLLWSKTNTSPFNSQIKIYKDKFFVIDFENILRCYSLRNGNEVWNVKTDQSFIKSQKKLSLLIVGDKLYFSNSIGDLSSVDIETGNLIWQTATQGSLVYQEAFFLKISDLVGYKDSILFSNNKNEFFSIDRKSGILNWKQRINSHMRPTIIGDKIFTVTEEGFLVIIDYNNGNILRITDLFEEFTTKYILEKKPIRAKFKPVGFFVGLENIYLTTDNGRLFIIDILTGRTNSIIKIDKEKISRPFVLNENLFIIRDNAIIKLN